MIKLESAHIEELRGIRKLDLDFNQETLSISGPNGSGKSGVIDAIEFGLTGEIGRLTRRGPKGLSVRNTVLTSTKRNSLTTRYDWPFSIMLLLTMGAGNWCYGILPFQKPLEILLTH